MYLPRTVAMRAAGVRERRERLGVLFRDVLVDWIAQSVTSKTVAGRNCKATDWAVAVAAVFQPKQLEASTTENLVVGFWL